MIPTRGSPRLRLRRLNIPSNSNHSSNSRTGNKGRSGQRVGGRGLLPAHDGAADDNTVDGDINFGQEGRQKRRSMSSSRWWADEYRCAALCIGGIVTLTLVLYRYDGKLAPTFAPGIKLDMSVIAIMTLIRVTLGSIFEACICQGAWVWVSKAHQARTRNRARLEDFKLFDEASRGFLGSLVLLWRLKGL